MRKVAVFFFSMNPGPSRQRVLLDDGTPCYIRAALVALNESEPLDRAFNYARADSDESLMNSHEIVAEATTR